MEFIAWKLPLTATSFELSNRQRSSCLHYLSSGFLEKFRSESFHTLYYWKGDILPFSARFFVIVLSLAAIQ